MILYILNIIDLLFTLHAISHGGVELNPFMQNVPFMIFYKIFVVGALIWVIRNERKPILFLTAVFAAVNVWHIVNIAARIAV